MEGGATAEMTTEEGTAVTTAEMTGAVAEAALAVERIVVHGGAAEGIARRMTGGVVEVPGTTGGAEGAEATAIGRRGGRRGRTGTGAAPTMTAGPLSRSETPDVFVEQCKFSY